MKITASCDQPLLEVLAILAPQSSKNTLRSWIREGRVQVDGTTAENATIVVLKGQEVIVGQRKKVIPPGIPVLYEDADLVVVNKPTGLLSVATAFEQGETLHALLKNYYRPRKVFVVHRLDQDSSGVMVFALNQKSSELLKGLFEVHDIEREYTAIVEGEFLSPSGTWQSHLYEDRQYHVYETEDVNLGRLAITHYKTVAATKRYSWLTLRLETGRKNQIRVHCESAGHSIVGDKKYGALSNPVKRLCLHAHLLSFQHPFSKKTLRFEAPVPEEFYRLMPSLKP